MRSTVKQNVKNFLTLIAVVSLTSYLSGCMSAISASNQDSDRCKKVPVCADPGTALLVDVAATLMVTDAIIEGLKEERQPESRFQEKCDIETQTQICSAQTGCYCRPIE